MSIDNDLAKAEKKDDTEFRLPPQQKGLNEHLKKYGSIRSAPKLLKRTPSSICNSLWGLHKKGFWIEIKIPSPLKFSVAFD